MKTWPTPKALKHAGKTKIAAKLKKHGARLHTYWATQIMQALNKQTVTITGTGAAQHIIPLLAAQLLELIPARAKISEEIEALVTTHPLYPVLTSMPSVAVRTAATIIAETSRTRLPHSRTPRFLRRPSTKNSPIRNLNTLSNRVPTRQQTPQKALFLSAFASLNCDPNSRTYYDRKRDEGKHHN